MSRVRFTRRDAKIIFTSFNTSLFSTLVASMEEEEFLTILCDLAILSKDILGIQWEPWYIKLGHYIGGSFIITRL
jgi:hypothetical protein